jgi:hypothetical protein
MARKILLGLHWFAIIVVLLLWITLALEGGFVELCIRMGGIIVGCVILAFAATIAMNDISLHGNLGTSIWCVVLLVLGGFYILTITSQSWIAATRIAADKHNNPYDHETFYSVYQKPLSIDTHDEKSLLL